MFTSLLEQMMILDSLPDAQQEFKDWAQRRGDVFPDEHRKFWLLEDGTAIPVNDHGDIRSRHLQIEVKDLLDSGAVRVYLAHSGVGRMLNLEYTSTITAKQKRWIVQFARDWSISWLVLDTEGEHNSYELSDPRQVARYLKVSDVG